MEKKYTGERWAIDSFRGEPLTGGDAHSVNRLCLRQLRQYSMIVTIHRTRRSLVNGNETLDKTDSAENRDETTVSLND